MELLTHSKRQAFLGCPRYFYWKHEKHLQTRAQRPGRRRGTIFGEALMTACDGINGDTFGLETLDLACVVIDNEYAELLQDAHSQEEYDDLELEWTKMYEVVKAYLDRYPVRSRREIEFSAPLINPATGGRSKTFRLAGKIDGIEYEPKYHVARVIEDKLVQSLQAAMIQRLPLDSQASEYTDALVQRGWNVDVAYRHTRWPGINPTKEKRLQTMTHPAETMDEFAERLRADIQERLDFYFDEQIVKFPVQHLEDYRQSRWGVARAIMDARLRAEHDGPAAGFPMNSSRCWEYGGCEFIPLCCKDSDAMSLYVVGEDNPELSIGGSDGNDETQG